MILAAFMSIVVSLVLGIALVLLEDRRTRGSRFLFGIGVFNLALAAFNIYGYFITG